jgi:hypothetical protein
MTIMKRSSSLFTALMSVMDKKTPDKQKRELIMIRYIHSNTRFEKMLNAMRTSEKMAVAAAKKAEEIIQNIRQNGDSPLSELGKFTRHGEFRIKNCIKYDIGKGYRFVCVKDDDSLYLLFVGTHDTCSAWVENNRNFIPDPNRTNILTYTVEHSQEDDTTDGPEHNEPDYDDLLLEKITDNDLKIVFNGLVNSVSCSV